MRAWKRAYYRDCQHIAVAVQRYPDVAEVVFQVIGFIELGVGNGQLGPAAGIVVLGAGVTHAAVLLFRLQAHLKAVVALFAIEYILYQAGHIGGHGGEVPLLQVFQ